MKESAAARLYLDLLKRTLCDLDAGVEYTPARLPRDFLRHRISRAVVLWLRRRGIRVMKEHIVDPAARAEGMDWPVRAYTMIGMKRLSHLQECVETVLREKVPGDLVETGVWRGGTVIFMRAILSAYEDAERTVWVADSFRGLPAPDAVKYPADEGDRHHTQAEYLGVSLEQVKRNFEAFGMLDDRVRFLEGWFRDTLPTAPIRSLSILRMDGDMYESTMDALVNLYPKLSPGGFAIVDDYFLRGCRQAVTDYREKNGITEEIHWIDKLGAFWRKR